MLEKCCCGQKDLPQKWAPVQLCRDVVQEQGVVEEDSQSVQSDGAEVGGSRLPCLRLPEDRRMKRV